MQHYRREGLGVGLGKVQTAPAGENKEGGGERGGRGVLGVQMGKGRVVSDGRGEGEGAGLLPGKQCPPPS